MPNFKIPKRFDSTIADSGVWFHISDEVGNEYGSFKCALIDKNTQRWKLAIKRLNAMSKGKPKDKNANFAVQLFVELSLQDWKMLDEKDKEVPFSKSAATEYFSMCDEHGKMIEEIEFVLDKLYDLAGDVSNYQPEGATIEDIEKN